MGSRLIWPLATVALVSACVGLSAWIYLRDRTSYSASRSARTQAEFDADRLLGMMVSPSRCAQRCSAEVLRGMAAHRWRVRVAAPSWQRCFILSVDDFGYSDQHGVTGVRSIRCHQREVSS